MIICKKMYLGPAVPLGLVLVVCSTSLEHRFVNPTSSSNNTDHRTVSGGDNLLTTGGELHSGK